MEAELAVGDSNRFFHVVRLLTSELLIPRVNRVFQ
jgi:hypothetical protein